MIDAQAGLERLARRLPDHVSAVFRPDSIYHLRLIIRASGLDNQLEVVSATVQGQRGYWLMLHGANPEPLGYEPEAAAAGLAERIPPCRGGP